MDTGADSQRSGRRRPLPKRYEPRLWQDRLFKHLRSTPRYRTAMRDLRCAWNTANQPTGIRHNQQFLSALGEAVRSLRLTRDDIPAPWAIEALHRDVTGRSARYRPDRMPMKAFQVDLEISCSPHQATIDLTTSNSAQAQSWTVKSGMPMQFDEWPELRKSVHAAADRAVDALMESNRVDPDLRWRNPRTEVKWERDCEALARILGGSAGATLSRGKMRHLCELLDIDPPAKMRENSA